MIRTVIPSDGVFNSHRTTIMDSFSCIRFLRKLFVNFHMRYYINIALQHLQLGQEMIGSVPTYDVDFEMFGGNDVKTEVMTSKLTW